jgi:chemotaxis protein CheD
MSLVVGRKVLIGLGGQHCSTHAGQLLVARPLGSTAALALYDPATKVGGITHWMLPNSELLSDRDGRNALLFADEAVPLLLQGLEHLGVARKARLRAALAGAASLPEGGDYDVGRRNLEAARNMIRRHRLTLELEDTGGVTVRELSLEVGTGEFFVHPAY